ncbi:hypothetical protein FBD94_05020 [Pedobacter hiemivivus]|uniref:Uncharacterized protein n=1 Tax=Pedobacter hiemivivus TaxID=2530454 RepID=A0A4U1GHN4_9SPHI|nr:DUF6266 family protein [Pedobacter hiemivivus]TKC63711.1 hypothetical protein FBD94_05020 [Pedobacter hiemivivus]
MARLPKGILGPITGIVGPVVGAVWKGVVPYVRLRPKKKKKKKRKVSPAQHANEGKFRFGNLWMIPFHPYIITGFQNMPLDKPAISIAFAINYSQAIMGTYPDFEIDYAKVVLSIGDLPGLEEPTIAFTASDTLELHWIDTKRRFTSFDDQIMLVLYSRELAMTDGFIGGIKRATKKCSFQFDGELVGKALDVYVSVLSLNRKKIANSIYLGRIEP